MDHVLAFDTETQLIRPGCVVPEMVCLSYQLDDAPAKVTHVRASATRTFAEWMVDPNVLLVSHNGFYDYAVMTEQADREGWGRAFLAEVFRAMDQGRVRDTLCREFLLANFEGKRQYAPRHYWTLASMAERYLGVTMQKGEDSWRLRYGELIGIPVAHWPEDARTYAEKDASTTMSVWAAQQQRADAMGYADSEGNVAAVTDEVRQVQGAWALHVMGAYGVRTDEAAVVKLAAKLTNTLEELTPRIVATGIMRDNGSKNMKVLRAAVTDAYTAAQMPVPQTEGGQVATDKETLTVASNFNPVLKDVVEHVHAQKILNTFVEAAAQGISRPINPRYNPMVASGRTSCSGPNMQNLPRADGVRQCFVPRPGYVYSSEDYSVLELRTLAQVCIDLGIPSRLALAFRANRDPHAEMGARLARVSFDTFMEWKDSNPKEFKHFRQLAKVADFGLPGGLGAQTFVTYAASSGVVITLKQAQEVKSTFLQQWPEMNAYFAKVSAAQVGGFIKIKQVRSNRVRGGCRYTAACNTYFQGLAADIAKDALYRVTKECLLDETSVLFGSRPVAFIHDELLMEHPEDKAAEAAARVAEIMVAVACEWTPDVPHSVEPTLMRCWEKEAKPVFDDDGKLIPWDAEAA